MKTQIQKEIRLLLPAWTVAVLLAVLPWHWQLTAFDIPSLEKTSAFLVGILLIGVVPFGREFSHTTFQLLLGQPIPRRRLWRDKTGVLGVATVSVWAVFWVTYSLTFSFSLWIGILSLLAAIGIVATGLWTTLLVREFVPAVCFSILIPAVVVPLAWEPFAARPPAVAAIALTLYSAANFALARWLFLRAQDLKLDPWVLLSSLTSTPSAAPSTPAIRSRNHGPLLSLALKEIRLQQAPLLAGLLLCLGLGFVAIFLAMGTSERTPYSVAMFLFTCLFIPILVAATSIAEERRLGLLETHFSLPVPRGRQYLVKVTLILITIIVFVIALPFFVWLGIAAHPVTSYLPDAAGDYAVFANIALLATATAFYASSLSKTPLNALLLTLALLPTIAFVLILSFHSLFGEAGPENMLTLLFRFGFPALSLIFVLLAFDGFRSSVLDSRARRRSAGFLGSALLGFVAIFSLIYVRSWEWVLPEPSLGPPEPSLSDGAEIYKIRHGPLFILLSDGRLWMSENPIPRDFRYPDNGSFLGESDWERMATRSRRAAAIRSDGSLWTIARWDGAELKYQGPEPMHTEAEWQSIAGGIGHFLAVRADGTLWGWGRNSEAELTGDLPRSGSITRVTRIGSQSDWSAVFVPWDTSVGIKEDGSTWRWGDYFSPQANRHITVTAPERWEGFPEGHPIVVDGWGYNFSVVLSDGSLWATDPDRARDDDRLFRLNQRKDWKSVVVWNHLGTLAALREDGSLWTGKRSPKRGQVTLEEITPEHQLSTQSRWVAITGGDDGDLIALADDGSLRFWEDREPRYRIDSDRFLAPSRWHQPLGPHIAELRGEEEEE